jgi:hypothetical protein
MIESVNCNTNIKRLDIGVLTDEGLQAVSSLLEPNTTLESITIQETKDPQKLWTAEGRAAFSSLLEKKTKIKRVSLHFTRENEDADIQFEAQIAFYTSLKAKAQATVE